MKNSHTERARPSSLRRPQRSSPSERPRVRARLNVGGKYPEADGNRVQRAALPALVFLRVAAGELGAQASQDETGCEQLDQRVKPESGKGERPGGDPSHDRDGGLDRRPGDRADLEPGCAALEGASEHNHRPLTDRIE